LKLAEGDHKVAAKILGITVAHLKVKINRSPELRAVWIKAKDIEAPTGLAVASRKAPLREVENSELALIIQDQNRAKEGRRGVFWHSALNDPLASRPW